MTGPPEQLAEDLGNLVEDPDLPVDPDVERTRRPRGRARARHLGRQAHDALRSRWDVLAVIGVGGAAGAAARYGVSQAWPHSAGGFPWATFTINVTGCLLLGLLMVFVVDVWPSSRYVRPLLGVGVLGGYTTFSTYALETRDLLVAGHQQVAAAYLVASLAGGLTAVWLGIVAARLLVRAATRQARRRTRQGRAARTDRAPRPGPAGRPTWRRSR